MKKSRYYRPDTEVHLDITEGPDIGNIYEGEGVNFDGELHNFSVG